MNSKGDRKVSWRIHSQVTGDGHQGIGHSGVGISAIGSRLQDPAADPRTAGAGTPGTRARHLSPEMSSCFAAVPPCQHAPVASLPLSPCLSCPDPYPYPYP